MSKMNGGQALVKSLYRAGIGMVFGLPGAGHYEAIDALHQESRIRYIATSGDGGFLYNSQALATAVQRHINAVVIVCNDNAYGNVLRAQLEEFDGHVLGTRLHNPDFVKLAEVYGARGIRAAGAEQLAIALREALTLDAPTPTNISTKSLPLMIKNGTPASPAMAFARRVFPVPGGPTSKMPLGMRPPILVNFFGLFRNSTISWTSSLASSTPATSLNVILF